MTWGALNNNREKTSAEPLPDFLTGLSGKGSSDRLDPQFQNTDEVIVQKVERPYGGRKESARGYGMAYPKSINIQMSKKTLFVSLVLFTTIILLTFCVGYFAGTLTASMSAPEATITTTPALSNKKPIIPRRKKARKESVKQDTEAQMVAALPKADSNDSSVIIEPAAAATTPENNNNKDTSSEPIYAATPPAEGTDDADD